MSLTEPTVWPAGAGAEAPADRPARMPAESPRTWSQLRSLSAGPPAGPAGGPPDWADDDRLDELFSAWARAAVATDAAPDGFAAADDRSRPVAAEPSEVRTTAATPPTRPGMDPFARPTLAPDAAAAVSATAADEASAPDAAAAVSATAADEASAPGQPATAWSRTDDDIIPTRRRGRWGRRG